MLREVVRKFPNAQIVGFSGQFLVHDAVSVGAEYIQRGIRNETDYREERGRRNIKSDLHPEVGTIFLMPPREFSKISLNITESLTGLEGWQHVVQRFVPSRVFRFLIDTW